MGPLSISGGSPGVPPPNPTPHIASYAPGEATARSREEPAGRVLGTDPCRSFHTHTPRTSRCHKMVLHSGESEAPAPLMGAPPPTPVTLQGPSSQPAPPGHTFCPRGHAARAWIPLAWSGAQPHMCFPSCHTRPTVPRAGLLQSHGSVATRHLRVWAKRGQAP